VAVAEKFVTVCSVVQVVPLLLPAIVQDFGSLPSSSFAVAHLYPLNDFALVNWNIKFVTFPFETKFKSSPFVVKSPSTSLDGSSPTGLLPLGFVTVTPAILWLTPPSWNTNSEACTQLAFGGLIFDAVICHL
jgi:hypothetical protein